MPGYLLNEWSRTEVQQKIISSLLESQGLNNVLESSGLKIVNDGRKLKIQQINRENLYWDRKTNELTINFTPVEDVDSSSSIGPMDDFKVSAEKLRTFAHDFTFALIEDSTDKRLDNFFPKMGDGYDHKTPDSILCTDEAMVILEFTTNQSNSRRAAQLDYGNKKEKYEMALVRRIARVKQTTGENKRYGFFPLVVCPDFIVCPVWFKPSPNLVSELTARFRFSLSILNYLIDFGFVPENDRFSQLKQSIINIIKGIEPGYQRDGDCIIPLTKERVLTADVDQVTCANFAKREYLKGLVKSKKDLMKKEAKHDRGEIIMRLINSNLGSRSDKKTLLMVPNVKPRKSTNWTPSLSSQEGDYTHFLNEVILETQKPEWRYEDSEEEMIKKALITVKDVDDKAENKTRRMYKRVNASPDQSERILFATIGVQGKDFSREPEVLEYRRLKKESFSLMVDTSDIDDFIRRPNKLTPLDNPPDDFSTSMVGISKAMELHDDTTSEERKLLNFVASTEEYHWLSFCSAIGVELSISLKQNVRKDEWVVKKLKDWDAYLVIKPTKSDSHIFYTVILPLESEPILPGSLAKKLLYSDKYAYTEWMSFTLSKMVNLIKCDVFYLTMILQWMRHFQKEIIPEEIDSDVMGMANLCLLIHMEDRPKTEEIFTLTRYICMDKFSMTNIDDTKMMEKIPNVLRSRMQVWAVHVLVDLMLSGKYTPSVMEEQSENGGSATKTRIWEGIMNPFINKPIQKPQQLIELFYVGYATNKDAKTWRNAEFDLIKKIVKYEKELDNVRPAYCGIEEEPTGNYRFHEWSRNMVCASADFVKRYMISSGGNGGDLEGLTQKIAHRLAMKTWEDVATLKASSTFDPWDKTGGETLRSENKRIKVVIAILRQWKYIKDTPALSIGLVLDWVDKDGGLRVDIFKKNQHGGLREIYVLEIHSRLLQLVLEEISRAVCAELPIEMMMHPESKIAKPQEHMYLSAKDPSKHKYNVSSSNDAKVWNQGHHVAKFCQFLLRLLPKAFHGFIVTGLKQWTKKRILMPTGVVDQLMEHSGVVLHDEIHDEIRKAYVGQINRSWLRKNESFLRIESGMMQGILHYMSSAFHASLLMLRDSLWHHFAMLLSINSKTIDLVSSDDSSRMTDVYAPTVESLAKSRGLAILDHLSIKYLSPYMGIWMSPKSTMCTNGVMEFNSEFFFRASHYRPTLKWVYASLGIVEVESMLERQEVLYNQVSELLEGGAGFKQTHGTQICQALLHYKLMGASVHRMFRKYIYALRSRPDPALGFFLLDPRLVAGLPGLSYSVWNVTKKSDNVSRIYANLLKQGEMTTTTTGMLTRGCQIRFGNRKKTRRLLQEAEEIMPDWRKKVEEDPMVLYMVARDLESSAIKILTKLTSPSVIRSLSQTNSLARMMAASTYVITGVATTLGSNWTAALKDLTDEEVKKVSLWNLLFLDLPNNDALSASESALLFPQEDHYRSLKRLLDNTQNYFLVRGGSQKMLRSHVQVYPEVHTSMIPLEQIVKIKWFNETYSASREIIEESWNTWKKHLPWLCDSPKETLAHKDCHFEGQIQLRNFIARQVNKPRMIHLTGAPIRDDKHKDILLSAILKNQATGFIMVCEGDPHMLDRHFSSIQSQVASILSFPLKNEERKKLLETTLIEGLSVWDSSKGVPERRRMQLHVIQECLRIKKKDTTGTPIRSLKIRELISKSKLGVIGGFTKRQGGKYGSYSGEGQWSGTIGSALVVLEIKDDCLLKIYTNDLSRLKDNVGLLNSLCREFQISTYEESFQKDSVYDLKGISYRGSGASIIVDREMRPTIITSLNIDISCSENNLRLICCPEVGKEFTILSYRPKSYDFSFLKKEKLEPRLYLVQQWMNNEPCESYIAADLLKKVLDGDVPRILDPRTMRDFFKDTLLFALAKRGWNFRKSWKDDLNFLSSASDEPEIDVMLDFDDMDLSEIDFGALLEVNETEDETNYGELEYDIHDFLVGEVGFPNQSDVLNIRRYHSFWADYVDEHTREFSEHQKRLLESGSKLRATGERDFIRVLEEICGLTFKPHGPSIVKKAIDIKIDDIY